MDIRVLIMVFYLIQKTLMEYNETQVRALKSCMFSFDPRDQFLFLFKIFSFYFVFPSIKQTKWLFCLFFSFRGNRPTDMENKLMVTKAEGGRDKLGGVWD